jgi:hypothetical protein
MTEGQGDGVKVGKSRRMVVSLDARAFYFFD